MVYHHVGRVKKLTSSREPDQELQRRQRVYRQPGVQQALVLVQNLIEIRKHSRLKTSLLKNIITFDPSGQTNLLKLTYLLLTFV